MRIGASQLQIVKAVINGSSTPEEIMEATGMTKSAFNAAAMGATEKKLIQRISRGRYGPVDGVDLEDLPIAQSSATERTATKRGDPYSRIDKYKNEIIERLSLLEQEITSLRDQTLSLDEIEEYRELKQIKTSFQALRKR